MLINSPDLSDCSKQSVSLLSRLNPNTSSCFYPLSRFECFDTCTQGDQSVDWNNDINIFNANHKIRITRAIIYAIILIISALLLMQFENIYYGHEEKDVALSTLKCLRLKNPNRIIIGHLNINSIRNKFVQLKHLIKDTISYKRYNGYPSNIRD